MSNPLQPTLEALRITCKSAGVRFKLSPPLPRAGIRATIEQLRPLSPESEIFHLYSACNGLEIGEPGQFAVVPAGEADWRTDELLSIREWGNGDCDVAQHTPGPCVVRFLGHDPPYVARVSPSIAQWLTRTAQEIISYEYCNGPSDCIREDLSDRLYSPEDPVGFRVLLNL